MAEFFSVVLFILVSGFFLFSIFSFIHYLIHRIISNKKGKK